MLSEDFKGSFSVLVEDNCESLAVFELKSRFNIVASVGRSVVFFDGSLADALRVAYFSQSAKRVLFNIGSSVFSDLDDLLSKIKSDLISCKDFSLFVPDFFRSSCSRFGAHDFNSVLVEQGVSGLVKQELSGRGVVSVPDYNSKDLVFFVDIVDDRYVFGLDLAGKDLSKRHYLIFNNPIATKGNVAFNFLLFSGFKPGLVLLDAFSLAGVIPIEAVIFDRGLSVNFFAKEFFFPVKIKYLAESLLEKFDSEQSSVGKSLVFSCDPSFPNISAQKKNSRIAGVEKHIAFARVDTRNLDIKNFKDDIDVVCSRIIEPSKQVSEQKALMVYEDFFVSASEFLSRKGSLNFIVRDFSLIESVAVKHGFVLKDSLKVHQGRQDLFFVKFVFKK